MNFRILLNETELIRLTSLGDERAFREIFDFYSRLLNHFVLRITHNQDITDDIVIDVFMKIWLKRTSLPEIDNFNSYLYAMVRNHAFNVIKRLAHETSIMNELSLSQTEYQITTEETVIYNDYKHLLNQTLNQLPPQQKIVYMLSHEDGLKYDEIAAEMNVSKNTVKSHLKKAVSTVRVAFADYLMSILIISFVLVRE